MTTEEKLRCERECTRLCNDFIFNIDRRNYDELLELFAPDPVLDRTGTVYKGLDGLRTFLAGRPGDMYVRHTSSNIRIDMTGPRTARGTSCATMFRAKAQPDAALPLPTSMLVFAEYEDDYALTNSGWKISCVECQPELTLGGADNNLDYLEVVHVFIRRPYSSRQALHQVRETDRTDHSTVGLPN